MIIDSGFKAIDNLVKKYDLIYGVEDNPFQKSVSVPATDAMPALREALSSFRLTEFPHSFWLKLTIDPGEKPMTVYQFKFPQINNQIICWLLVNEKGYVVEIACPINKKKYIDASKCIARELLHLHPMMGYTRQVRGWF
ncbi:MAG: hypothetical protein ACI88A_003177 [Paraglaciecola sp.]|jgi:hypothetical protein